MRVVRLSEMQDKVSRLIRLAKRYVAEGKAPDFGIALKKVGEDYPELREAQEDYSRYIAAGGLSGLPSEEQEDGGDDDGVRPGPAREARPGDADADRFESEFRKWREAQRAARERGQRVAEAFGTDDVHRFLRERPDMARLAERYRARLLGGGVRPSRHLSL
jgi:hypothetical protein